MRDFPDCHAYAVRLQHAHRQIHQVVGEIEHELSSISSAGEQMQLCVGLRQLHSTLVGHFKDVEEGGCLEAVSSVPRLSSDVAEIAKENTRILKLLDRLIKRSGERLTDDFRVSFRQFAKILRAHEAAENRILQTAFGPGEFENNASPSLHGE